MNRDDYLNSGPFSDNQRRILVSAYETNPMPDRAVHLELAQKLNRRLRSIRAWFSHRRYNESKEMDGEEEEKTKRGKTQRRKINRKPKKKAPVTGAFSEESRQILFASFEANPLPGSDGYRELAIRLNRKPASIKDWFKQRRREKRQAELQVEPVPVLPGQAQKTAKENEESDEEEYEILTSTISKPIYVDGPIINKDGVKVGSVTAEEVRKYF